MSRRTGWFLAVMVLGLACTDSTGPDRPSCTVSPCVAALVNGSPWADSGFTPGAAARRSPSDTLIVSALRRRPDDAIEAINIRITSFAGPGTYTLGDSSSGRYAEFGLQLSGASDAVYYRTTAAMPGTITVATYDTVALEARGTFAFDTPAPSPYRVTQGVFRVGLLLQ